MHSQPKIQYVQLYTDGSAARKLATPSAYYPAYRPKAKPAAARRKKVKIYPVETLAVLTAIAMLITILVGAFAYSKKLDEYQTMSRYVTELENQRRSLVEEYESAYDENQVRQTAEAIGMVPCTQVRQTTICVTASQQEEAEGNRLTRFLTSLFA